MTIHRKAVQIGMTINKAIAECQTMMRRTFTDGKCHRVATMYSLVIMLSLTWVLMPIPSFAWQPPSDCTDPDDFIPDNDGDECVVSFKPKTKGGPSCENACSQNQKKAGDPIDVATGNKYEEELDYSSAGPSPLVLSRYYNSYDSGLPSLGIGWRIAYSRAITSTSATTADAARDDGKVLTFTLTSGLWTADSDVNSKLVKLTTGGWQYTSALDEVELYNNKGQLIKVTNRAGLSQTLGYDSLGRMATVSNPYGASLKFNYTGNSPRIYSVTVPNGGIYKYGYDTSNNLTTVTYPDASKLTYVYGNTDGYPAFPNALSGVIDENGNRYITDKYDSIGRDYYNGYAGGVKSYTLDFSNQLSAGSVLVTDALGTKRTSQFNTVNGVSLETGLTQNFCPTSSANSNCVGGTVVSTTGTQYDANGNLSSETDFNGNTTCYLYDLSRNLEKIRLEGLAPGVNCPANLQTYTPTANSTERLIKTDWHAKYRLPAKITAPTQSTDFSYDAKTGNLLKKTLTDTSSTPVVTKIWRYTYNSAGQPLTIDGPRTDVQDITRFSYGAQSNLSSVTDALGHVTHILSYNADGQPLQIKQANGLINTLHYDKRGRLFSVSAGTETTRYTYDAAGLLKKITLPDSSYLSYGYDTAHRLSTITDSLGNQISYNLDNMGNALSTQVKDPSNTLSQTQTQVFDGLSRLILSIGLAGQPQQYQSQFGYDLNGNKTQVTDAHNNLTKLSYDPLDRLNQSIDPYNNATKISYDSNDNPQTVIDPLAHSTGYSYDGFGQLKATTSPDTGKSRISQYDLAGNALTRIDARGQTVSYRYDALNRLTQIRQTNLPPINFSYDQGTNGIGHLTQISDGRENTQWVYDQHGRVITQTFVSGSLTLTTHYQYNTAGQLFSISYPSGQTVQRTYQNGLIAALDNKTTPLLSHISYQPFGAAKQWTFGNGITTSRSFDADGHLQSYDLGGSRSRTVNYDAGRIAGYTDSDLNHDQSFGYDNLNRLSSYSDPVSNILYQYDANGNRSQTSNPTQTNYTTDALSNKLLSLKDSSQKLLKSYSYDTAGNLKTDGYTTYNFDGRGRLVLASNVSLGASGQQYRVNGLGQRDAKVTGTPPDLSGDANQDGTLNSADLTLINNMLQGTATVNLAGDCNKDGSITVADSTCTQAKIADMKRHPANYVQTGTYFVYDQAGHLLGEYSQTGSVIQETVWLGDIPVAVLQGNKHYYIYADHLNAPRAISDNTGTVIWRWDSEAFGTQAANEDPDGNHVTFSYNLRFPGQYFDSETGLFYNGFRDYNPNIGRYVESDPIGLLGGLNTYAYVNNNPLRYTDPQGELVFLAVPIATAAAEYLASAAVGAAIGVGIYNAAENIYNNSDARDIDFIPGKSDTANPGNSSTLDDAIDTVRNGGDVIAKDQKTARDIAGKAGCGEPVLDPPHKEGQRPHYHPTDAHGNRLPGHVLF